MVIVFELRVDIIIIIFEGFLNKMVLSLDPYVELRKFHKRID